MRRLVCTVVALLLIAGCGRRKYTGAEDDAGLDASTVEESLAHIELDEGWTVEVWRDFSEEFEYVAEDWIDGGDTYDNAPTSLFELSAPFDPGIGITAGRAIVELPASGDALVRDYRPPANNHDQLPDLMSDAVQIGPWDGNSDSILVTSTSELQGDGLYLLNTDWLMSRALSANNVRGAAFDPTGAFDGLGTPQVYWGGSSNMFRYEQPNPVSLRPGVDTIDIDLMPNGNLLIVQRTGDPAEMSVLIYESITHQEFFLGGTASERLALVRGATTQDSSAYVRDRDELVVYSHGSLPEVVVARSLDPEWIWRSALVVGEGPLTSPGYYLLEYNPTRNLERVVRIVPE